MAMDLTQDKHLSLSAMLALRGEAFARVRWHAAEVITVSDALDAFDAALRSVTADDKSSEALVNAARQLAFLMDVG